MKNTTYVHLLCTKCKKIISVYYGYNYLFGCLLMILSISITYPWISDSSLTLTSKLFGSFIIMLIFIAGLMIVIKHTSQERICPLCDGKETLIKIDTPEAIEIIKENNLSIPQKFSDDDRYPWETKKS